MKEYHGYESFRLSVLEALNEYMLESIHDDEELWKITVADKQLALKDFAKYLGATEVGSE